MAETIYERSVQDVLPSYFLTYAQSVLQDRAIPSGFDGLKPVHRRVLMSFNDLKLFSNVPYQKCAKVCGIALGNYHPHGDQSVYEALVGLAQDFNMRYPLVDGSGNFGSIDGQPSAAMRYTQARLSPFGELMLQDVENLSDMKDNFDNTSKEPVDLPTYFPNLLMNGIPTAIAVGMATKFAPHYAKDIYNAILYVIDCQKKNTNPDIEKIIDIIKAPDFPTGAQIINGNQVRNIYRTGKGAVTLRAKYIVENNSIIYTEIPYKVTPSSIVQAIASLNISDIRDVRDESSEKSGLRIVVELKKNANADWIINKLFKETPLQSNFNVNMIAIMNNRPEGNLNILQIIGYYLQNLSRVHYKKINLELQTLEKKLFNTQTMLNAIERIDDIINIIKTSEEPVASLVNELTFTKEQAEYICSLRLSFLSKASKTDLESKEKEYLDKIHQLQLILSSQNNFLSDITDKIRSIRDSKIFKNDVRRTEILNLTEDSSQDERNFVKNEPVVITYSNKDMIKATRPEEYKTNKRNAMGVVNKTLREDEYISQMLTLNTHDNLLLFSDLGRCYLLPVYKIPISGRNESSRSINNFVNLTDGEKILSIVAAINSDSDNSIIMVTSQGIIKRVSLKELLNGRISTVGTKAITLMENDRIRSVSVCEHGSNIIIFTSQGRGLKINIDDEDKPIRSMGKSARGLTALKLKADETVVSASKVEEGRSVILVTTMGFGKRLLANSFKDQKRNQAPINYFAKIDKVGKIVNGLNIGRDEDLLITTKMGQTLRIDVNNIKPSSRTASGVKFINIKESNDSVVSISTVKKEEVEDESKK